MTEVVAILRTKLIWLLGQRHLSQAAKTTVFQNLSLNILAIYFAQLLYFCRFSHFPVILPHQMLCEVTTIASSTRSLL